MLFISLSSFSLALPHEANNSINFVYPEESNITYINNTYINETLELNSTQFETGEPATIKTSWLETFVNSIIDLSDYIPYTGATQDVNLGRNNLYLKNKTISSVRCPEYIIAHWGFDNNAQDSIGDNDGIWEGTEGYLGFKADKGASFDYNSKISVSSSNELQLENSWTIWFWLRHAGSSSSNIIDKGNYKIEFVAIDAIAGRIKVSVMGEEITSGNVIKNTNYFIAVVRDESAQNLKLYVNGVKVNETTLTSSVTPTTEDLVIGENFLGYIDELAFYDTSVTSEEVNKTYNYFNNGYYNYSNLTNMETILPPYCVDYNNLYLKQNDLNETQFERSSSNFLISISTTWLNELVEDIIESYSYLIGNGTESPIFQNTTTNYIKLNETTGACDLTINGTICSNATGTYIVG